MAATSIPQFHNDPGVDSVEIGSKTFECIGASAPYDHPHVYLDMGSEGEIVCPYCSTHYTYSDKLTPAMANPTACAQQK